MALARTWAVTVTGVEGAVVEVEADLAQGLPGLSITGLPDASLQEARDRVRAAVVNSGFPWPFYSAEAGWFMRANNYMLGRGR